VKPETISFRKEKEPNGRDGHANCVVVDPVYMAVADRMAHCFLRGHLDSSNH
jgi:hypothetical protein